MGLLDRLLDQTRRCECNGSPANFRVLLDDEGRVCNVVLERSSGDAAVGMRGHEKFSNMTFPRSWSGGSTKRPRRWHEVAYTDNRSG